MLSLCIASTWAQDYIPVRRVTFFESGKHYMLYNTAFDNTASADNQDRTGFIYVNDGVKKWTGANRNPREFFSDDNAYLWNVTVGDANLLSLQNVSTGKYMGYSTVNNKIIVDAFDSNPNHLYLYQWGSLTGKQAGVSSENEDRPSQKTASNAITFADNKVFLIGGTGDQAVFWNGNPGDIVTWGSGHPFAFYEVASASDVAAEVMSEAYVGTYAFQANTLTTGASTCTIAKANNGDVTISSNSGSFGRTSGRFFGTLVVKINLPGTTTAGVLCEMRQTSDNPTYSQGLYMAADRVLKTSWQGEYRTGESTTLDAGEHTIVYTTGEDGARVFVDGEQKFTDSGLKASGINYKAIYIPAAYASYVTEVYFWGTEQRPNYVAAITKYFYNKHMHASQQSGTTAKVAADKTLILDKAVNWTSLTGTGTVLQDVNITTNVAGALPALTLKATAGTLSYTGASLTGTTLDGVVLAGSGTISTSGEVNIKNLAGNNLTGSGNYGYAFVGDGTLNFYGTCDLTKKSDGTTASVGANIGYPSTANINVKQDAVVTAGIVLNTTGDSNSNASITVESGATLNTIGWTHTSAVIYATNLTNNGTINISTGRYSEQPNQGYSVIHSTLSGSGTLNVYEGSRLTASSVPSTMTLTGAGIVELGTFPTSSAPNVTGWTGTVLLPQAGDKANLTAIFNAWGNANSTIQLNSVTGYFNESQTVKPTLDILSGATVTVNNGSSNKTPVLAKVTGAGTLAQTWSGGSNYTLKIATLTGFTGTLRGTNKPIAVDKLVLATAPYPNTRLIKTSASNVTLDKLYIGLQGTTAYSWAINTVDDVTGIYVTDVNLVQLAREDATNTITPYYNYVGTGVGKYTVRLNNVDYTDINEVESAIQEWNLPSQIPVTITINQPTSAFYRLKSGSQYLQDVRKSSEATQRTMTSEDGANTAAKTLFYLDGDNKFVGYQTGYGFGYSVCQTQNTEELNSVLFTESSEKGKYTIQSQQGTCTSASYNTGYWGVDGNDLSRKNNVADGANWTLETVTSIPVTFNPSALGYATFNSPVALAVPEGVEAYVCKIDGNKIKLFKANQLTTDGLWILPANTPVLLYNASYETDATKNFAVTSTDETYDNNGFYGTSASETPDATNYLYYALRKKGEAMGFYQRADQAATLTGFRAWIRSDKAAGARNFVISFDGDSDPTGIAEALGLQDEKVEIYDLNGRKLTGYQKGINIVNGKKVFK